MPQKLGANPRRVVSPALFDYLVWRDIARARAIAEEAGEDAVEELQSFYFFRLATLRGRLARDRAQGGEGVGLGMPRHSSGKLVVLVRAGTSVDLRSVRAGDRRCALPSGRPAVRRTVGLDESTPRRDAGGADRTVRPVAARRTRPRARRGLRAATVRLRPRRTSLPCTGG